MREDLETKISTASTLLDVLMILKEKIMLDTHVSTLAYVDEIVNDYGLLGPYSIIKVKPFPLDINQEEYTLQAYCFKNTSFAKNDLVLVIFTDKNFILNLNSETPKETQDLQTHLLKYGVVIPIALEEKGYITKKECEDLIDEAINNVKNWASNNFVDINALSSYATQDWVSNQGYLTSVEWNDINDKPTFATVATTGSYNDLIDIPSTATVNDATLTIQKNGTNIATFTANSSIDVIANIIIPTKTSDLTNDSGFITNTVNNLTNYTLSSSLATVATTGSYNDLTNKPTIPTKTSDLTNDSGYIGSSDLSNYVDKTILTTAGDIIYASAASTPTRLGIGTTGQVLTVSSNGIPEWTNGSNFNYYHTPTYSSGLDIATGSGVNDLYVPSATSSDLGVIKLGSSTTQTTSTNTVTSVLNRTYAIQENSNNQLVVNIPWTDTHGDTEWTYYSGNTLGECYYVDSPNSDYSIQIGDSGFTVDTEGTESGRGTNILLINENTFTYSGYAGGSYISAYHVAIGSTTGVGTSTRPIYLNSNGELVIGSFYAGGTSITLNGTSKSGTTASFYAPLTDGNSGQIITTDGSGNLSWINFNSSDFVTTVTPTIKYLDVNYTAGNAVISGTTQYMHFSAGTTPPSSATFNGTTTSDLVTDVAINSQGSVSLTANTSTATGRITYVQDISGSAPSLGGTTTFVTNRGTFTQGSGSLTSSSSGDIAYVESVSYISPSLSGTTTFNTDAIKSATITATRSTSGSGTNARRTLTLSNTTTSASTGTVSLSSGSITPSTKYLTHTHTASSLGSQSTSSVTISGGSYTSTTRYLSASHSGTTLTITKDDYTPEGSISLTSGTAPSLTFNTTSSGGQAYIKSLSTGSVGGSATLTSSTSGTIQYVEDITIVKGV